MRLTKDGRVDRRKKQGRGNEAARGVAPKRDRLTWGTCARVAKVDF